MLKLKKSLICLFIFLALFLLLQTTAMAASIGDAFREPLEDVAGSNGAGYKSDVEPEAIIGLVIQVALSFVGMIMLVILIYGGYLWMMSRGNEQQVEKAKNLFTAAIIGLIIVISAYAISYFVLWEIGKKIMPP